MLATGRSKKIYILYHKCTLGQLLQLYQQNLTLFQKLNLAFYEFTLLFKAILTVFIRRIHQTQITLQGPLRLVAILAEAEIVMTLNKELLFLSSMIIYEGPIMVFLQEIHDPV